MYRYLMKRNFWIQRRHSNVACISFLHIIMIVVFFFIHIILQNSPWENECTYKKLGTFRGSILGYKQEKSSCLPKNKFTGLALSLQCSNHVGNVWLQNWISCQLSTQVQFLLLSSTLLIFWVAHIFRIFKGEDRVIVI